MAKPTKMNTCGCCDGLEARTPRRLWNLPSQTTIDYRIGTHSAFKASMLTALSKAENAALQALGTRDDDDFTIAWLDGVATMLDVLTFHQERYVNENYLAPSTERRSVLEMAQLIGYELSPGVAASTHLAFTLQSTPGDPASAVEPITIPVGTRVQSVPGQDENPQVFETTAPVEARAEWNEVRVQTTTPYIPTLGDLDVYIDGVGNNVEAGDALLIVGQHRSSNPGSERWDVRVVSETVIDEDNDRTQLVWEDPLGHRRPTIRPSDTDVRLYVFRSRAALFGHNAPDPRLMSEQDNNLGHLLTGLGISRWWANYRIRNNQIDLSAPDDKVTAGSWVALVSNESGRGSPSLPGYVELYRVDKVSTTSRTDYGMSGKITRIEPDTTENLSRYDLQDTLALVATEELPLHERPLPYPLFGDAVGLGGHVEGLEKGRFLAISGQRQRLEVAPGKTLTLESDGGDRPLNEGDSVQIVGPPEKLVGGAPVQLGVEEFGELVTRRNPGVRLVLRVTDRDGTTGSVRSYGADWRWDDSDDDPRVAEIAEIDNVDTDDRDRTYLGLALALGNVYRRETVRINFNVAPANNGETVVEILGDGDARRADQSFVLKQTPMTYVSADTTSGRASTLDVRVNELRWNEVDTLYRADPSARIYEIRNRDDGATEILFGDGLEGARLPTGQTNVRATYRKYVGAAANLDRDKLTTLLQKPLGVTAVTNPEPATGGADREGIGDAKRNAPLTVLTLDRAVSVQDYELYARAFAGIAKAHALWIASGPSRGIYITVAGTDGSSVPSNGDTYKNLMASLRRFGDPMLPLRLVNYTPAEFVLGMAVKVDADADRDAVLASLDAELRDHFSFDNREFGQHASQDEVLAVVHRIPLVEAVRITRFHEDAPGASGVETIIPSSLPIASLTVPPQPAVMLTLSSKPIEMGTFS